MAADAAVASEPNPAVAEILRGATTTTAPSSSPVAAGRPLSLNPEAVRARRRREAAKAGRPPLAVDQVAPPAPPPIGGRQLTPEALRAEISNLPAPVVTATAAQVEAASNFVAMTIRAAGWAAAAVFKSDDMKVPETDAQETARLIVDGWPELATTETADAKKTLALMAVGSLVVERYGKYQRARAASGPAPVALPGASPTTPTQNTPSLTSIEL